MGPQSGKLASVDDLICAESSKIVSFLLRPAGGGDDAIAELVEERNRDRPHPTGSAGHEHIAPVRRDACLFQSQHAKHGGVAGGADRHGVGGRNVLGKPDKPVALNAGPLGVAAVVHLAQVRSRSARRDPLLGSEGPPSAAPCRPNRCRG